MTPEAPTLAAFLEARIAEDEAVARDATRYVGGAFGPYNVGSTADVVQVLKNQANRWTPARSLAECDAKRRILDLHRPRFEIVEWFDSPTGQGETCPSCRPSEPTYWNPPVGRAGVRPDGFVAKYTLAPCPTLRALAAPFADHPEFRQEWTL